MSGLSPCIRLELQGCPYEGIYFTTNSFVQFFPVAGNFYDLIMKDQKRFDPQYLPRETDDENIGTLAGILTSSIIVILVLGTCFFFYKSKNKFDVKMLMTSLTSSFHSNTRSADNSEGDSSLGSAEIVDAIPQTFYNYLQQNQR